MLARRAAPGAAVTGRGSGRRWPWALALVALVGAAGGAAYRFGPWFGSSTGAFPPLPFSSSETATLYFADPRWTRLAAEGRRLQPRVDAVARLRSLVEALAEGPRSDAAVAALPKGTRLRAAYVGKGGLAVIDFEPWPEGTEFGGTSGETLAVFSVVETVVRNVPGIQAVQFLVGGTEQETLAGHVKLSEPLRAEAPAGASAR